MDGYPPHLSAAAAAAEIHDEIGIDTNHHQGHASSFASQERSSSTQSTHGHDHPKNSYDMNMNLRHSLTWTLVHAAGSIPPARSGAASVILQNKLFMFGGYGGGTGRLDDFHSFSFDTNTWEEVEVLSDEKPGCRENNGVVTSDNSKVYLFGGYNGHVWLNDLWMFDIVTKCWTCLQESSDINSLDDESTRSGSSSYHFREGRGGRNNNNNSNNGNGHSNGDNVIEGRRSISSKIPSRRFGYVSVVHNNKFILWGGFDGQKWLNDMYEFDFDTKTWREVHALGKLPSVRSCPAYVKDDTRVYIQGGYDGMERKSDFYSFDLDTYTWNEMPAKGNPPSPRYFHSCCLYDNKMHVYGGYNGSQRLSDMYYYDFETQVWSQINAEHGCCPSGRSSLVAQIYGNSLYAFGGYNGDTVLNDFYKIRLKAVSIPSSGYDRDMLKLIDNQELSDVTFLVEGKMVYANRAILATRSEYFHIMFFSGAMRESIQSTEDIASNVTAKNRRAIEIQDVSHVVFMKVLEYIYTDSLKNINVELGIPLLITSERFMLDRLKAICEDKIRQDVTVVNVLEILLTSHRHNATGLKDIALEFILRNLKNETITKNLTDLKSEPDLLIEIIRRNSSFQSNDNHVALPQTPSGPFCGADRWGGTRR
mmetsp:Transcript_16875/g.20609  ORF Transcript_16875/g.20609 Transcript_16875/m.20609 type:complete len:648 (-) Transcript_16875:63-2006(-)